MSVSYQTKSLKMENNTTKDKKTNNTKQVSLTQTESEHLNIQKTYPNIIKYLVGLQDDYPDLDIYQHIQTLSKKWLPKTLYWIEKRFDLPHPKVSELMLNNSVKGVFPIDDPDTYPRNKLVRIIRSSGEVYPVVFRYCVNGDVFFLLPKDVNTIDDYKLEKKSYQKYKDFFYDLTDEEIESCFNQHPMLRMLE